MPSEDGKKILSLGAIFGWLVVSANQIPGEKDRGGQSLMSATSRSLGALSGHLNSLPDLPGC